MVNQVNASQVVAEVAQTGPGLSRATSLFAEVVHDGAAQPARATSLFSEVVQNGAGLNARATTVFIEVVQSLNRFSGWVSVAGMGQ